jgi:hypothetical protein
VPAWCRPVLATTHRLGGLCGQPGAACGPAWCFSPKWQGRDPVQFEASTHLTTCRLVGLVQLEASTNQIACWLLGLVHHGGTSRRGPSYDLVPTSVSPLLETAGMVARSDSAAQKWQRKANRPSWLCAQSHRRCFVKAPPPLKRQLAAASTGTRWHLVVTTDSAIDYDAGMVDRSSAQRWREHSRRSGGPATICGAMWRDMANDWTAWCGRRSDDDEATARWCCGFTGGRR